MSVRRRSISQLRLAALSFAGVIAGHLATYAVVAPDPHHRRALLETTGHGSWAVPVFLAAAAFLAVACGVLGKRSRPTIPYRALTGRLIILQVGGFSLLEISERAFAHSSTTGMIDRAILIGAAVQVLVAAIAPLLVWVVGRSLLRLRTLFLRQRGCRTTTPGWASSHSSAIPRSTWRSAPPPRAPPVLRST